MFHQISWQAYGIFMSLLTISYYSLVGSLYYRTEVKTWVQAKCSNKSPTRTIVFPSFAAEGQPAPGKETMPSLSFLEERNGGQPPLGDEEAVMGALMDEVSAYLEAAGSIQCDKETLLCSLRRIIQKHSLKAPAYQASLENAIRAQCEQLCAVHFGVEDLARLWTVE